VSRAVVLWTGGKDSALALDIARRSGLDVVSLVTFAPRDAHFRAHPLPIMAAQAASLGLPHQVVAIDAPYDASYRRAFEALAADGVTHVVTGDIDRVDGRPNWVRERAAGLPLEVVTPLWDRERGDILSELAARGFRAVVSCVRDPLPPALCGRPLDDAALTAIRASGPDPCAAYGAEHTVVHEGPRVAHPLALEHGAPVTGDDGLTTLASAAVLPERR
jgi:diphthine-ammonia ligase